MGTTYGDKIIFEKLGTSGGDTINDLQGSVD